VSLVLADDGEPLYFVSQIQDITDRKTRERSVAEAATAHEHEATHDALTGLANRRLLEQRLSSLLDTSGRRAATCEVALLFCDLDGFKAVNDEHGHDAGDYVLRETASRLTATARSDDTVCRLGGDEFVVLMTTRPDEDARAVTAAVARRICDSLARIHRFA
jgi:diguanylate cyclase (GGDEF)-like protein